MRATAWIVVAALAWAAPLGLAARASDVPPQQIVLRYASPYPSSHPFSRADLAWITWVERESAGRLHIDAYWGGTLMSTPESVLELAHGVADIATVLPIYSLAGAQAIKLQASFYAGADTPAMQVAVYECLRRQFPVLDRELAGTHLLAIQGGSLPHVLTRTRPIRGLADFSACGCGVPNEMVPVLRAMGADPVTMAMGDVYSALSKGSVDGVVAPADTMLSLHFGEGRAFVQRIDLSARCLPGARHFQYQLEPLAARHQTASRSLALGMGARAG